MSLTIREKALLATGLIVVILVAPTAYAVLMLREISALAATLAETDARAGVQAARLGDLFGEAHRSARLVRVDPVFLTTFDATLEEMRGGLEGLRNSPDAAVARSGERVIERLEDFRALALSEQSDGPQFERAEASVREALSALTGSVQRLAARRTAEAESLAEQAATLSLGSAAIGLLVAIALWALLMRALTRPLRDLVAGTARIGRGQFDETIPVRADDELGRLAGAFNRMAGALADLERMKAEFLAAASHGLRTPVACAKGYVASLSSGRQGPLPDEARRSLFRIEEELERVSRFVDQLLDLGRLRSGRLPLTMRELPAVAFFTSVGRSFEALAEQRGIDYQIHVENGLPPRINADPDRLGEALINLLGNAFKFTPAGGRVNLTVRGEDGWIRVEVADNGPGIPRGEVPLIFEKYYRGDGVSAEGSGLGLAIARGIVERHGGDIWAVSEEGEGARFIFRVPATKAGAARAAS